MSRSSTKKTTTSTAAAPAAARPRASAPLRRSGSSAATSAAHLTSQRIAADVAAFKKAGGRIEVLGNTPLRNANNASPFRSSPELRKPPTPVARARKA